MTAQSASPSTSTASFEFPESTYADAREILAKYPHAQSALLPLLHLVQSVQGYVSPAGIAFCAQQVGITTAEVAAAATFYTMYHRKPAGEFHIGVCINPGCGLLGGDAIYERISARLGIGHDEVTEDGRISLERIECQAACTHAPVMTANWEFLDDMTPAKADALIDDIEAGRPVTSTRGPVVPTFKANERVLAGLEDGLDDEGPQADDRMLAGLRRAKELGMRAPEPNASSDSHAEA